MVDALNMLHGRHVEGSLVRAATHDTRCRLGDHYASVRYRRCKASRGRKEDDFLIEADIQAKPDKVSMALFTELKSCLCTKFFNMQEIAKASNIATSRYVYKWEIREDEKGEMERTIRLRLVLRVFMDLEAFDVEAFSGTARRSSQRLLASAAACKKQWIIASLDINTAFLQGFTYQELAEATGEKEHVV
eukprot:9503254-Pyramimonas_sp.AAC.1